MKMPDGHLYRRARSMCNKKMPHEDTKPVQEERDLAYWLRGVMQLCIYPPLPRNARLGRPREMAGGGPKAAGDGSSGGDQPVVAWSCAEVAVMSAIKEKDPLGLGLPNSMALRLLQVSRSCFVMRIQRQVLHGWRKVFVAVSCM